MPVLEIIIHYIHLLAALSWVGGMIFVFTSLIPALKANTGPEKRLKIMRKVGRNFAVVSWISIGLLVATGGYKVITKIQAGSVPILYWQIISIKATLVILAIALSILHDFVWGPRLSLPRAGDNPNTIRRRVLVVARMHLIIVLVIVFLGVFLGEIH